MSAHEPLARPYARFVPAFAAAAVLLSFFAVSGCEDKSTSTGQQAVSSSGNPDKPASAKFKRTPRTPK